MASMYTKKRLWRDDKMSYEDDIRDEEEEEEVEAHVLCWEERKSVRSYMFLSEADWLLLDSRKKRY